MTRPYRIKHIPSGLYYHPVRGYAKSNLSKTGKAYITNVNPLTSKGRDYIYIQVDKYARVFNSVKGLFPLNNEGNIEYRCPKDQFKIEEL